MDGSKGVLKLGVKFCTIFWEKGMEQCWQMFSVKVQTVKFWNLWARCSLLQTSQLCPYSVKVAIDNT